MQDNYKLGAVLAVIGAIVGMIGFFVFVQIYNPLINTMINLNRSFEGQSVRYTFAVLGYLTIAAGALWTLALYGFLTQERWAWMLGIIASTLSILAGFFPAVPAMDAKVVPTTLVIFVPSLLLWLALLLFVRKTDWRIVTLALTAGIAFTLSFMDGVAPIAKFHETIGQDAVNGLYLFVQQINWWASAAWAVFIFALVARKPWSRVVGIGAGLLECWGGYPVGILNMLEVKRFSLFLPAPLLSTALVIFLMLPYARKLLADWASGKESADARVRTVEARQTVSVVH
ncbi:MAG: hypothetical protein KGJ80_09315 [Chloroflexota bacterium]|nr:hypothetical protein [Chloroflexota bacterium]